MFSKLKKLFKSLCKCIGNTSNITSSCCDNIYREASVSIKIYGCPQCQCDSCLDQWS